MTEPQYDKIIDISETNPSNQKLELSSTPEGKEIRDRLEKEFNRRVTILKKAIEALQIPDNLVVLAPPVLDRTDFGYVSDIDFVFFGSSKQRENLNDHMYSTYKLLPHIIHFQQERLAKIQSQLPELYQFLMDRRGNIPKVAERTDLIDTTFFNEELDLETKTRSILQDENKPRLKSERLRIGEEFVNDYKKKISVLSYYFSGSMMENIKRFGINSDLDIEFLTNPKNETEEKNAYDWMSIYCKWKYAEKYGIKVDSGTTSLHFARQMAKHDSRFIDHFSNLFGIDIMQQPEENIQ